MSTSIRCVCVTCPEADAPANTDLPLLEVGDLRFQRGDREQGFSVMVPGLVLRRGELVALTGESGSGKSTVLELLGLVAEPQDGAVFRWRHADGGDTDIAALWRRDDQQALAALRATSIGYVMQTGGLLAFFTVWENIVINRRLLGLSTEDSALDQVVDHLEIRALLRKMPRELSIGQQQRVSIARALAHGPELLLADEPSSALDPRLADKVLELLFDLATRLGVTTVIATHEQRRVSDLGLRQIAAVPWDGQTRFGSRFEG